MNPLIEKIAAFIREIGISISFCAIKGECFLPGICIENGSISVDIDRLENPGDLLHECGHIAIVPASERSELNSETISNRPSREAEEMMAIAWSYAAAIHIGIDPYLVFHENGYKGGGENLIQSFTQSGTPIGVPMLQYHHMTYYGNRAAENNVTPFPAMVNWTRDQ